MLPYHLTSRSQIASRGLFLRAELQDPLGPTGQNSIELDDINAAGVRRRWHQADLLSAIR